jgi:hypothetical protein
VPLPIADYLDPPAAAAKPKPEGPPQARLMLEALLAPQSIQWMLVLGGGLTVLGMLIWLATLGVFKNAYVLWPRSSGPAAWRCWPRAGWSRCGPDTASPAKL